MGSVALGPELDRRQVAEALVVTLLPATEDHGKRAVGRVIAREQWLSVAALTRAIEATAPAPKRAEHVALEAPDTSRTPIEGGLIGRCYREAAAEAASVDPEVRKRGEKALRFWGGLAKKAGVA